MADELSPFTPLLVPLILLALTVITLGLVIILRQRPVTKQNREVEKLLVNGDQEVQGTVYLSDGEGHVVRRSTRARKPPPSPGYAQATPVKAKVAAEGTPAKSAATVKSAVTPRATRTSRTAAAVAVVPPEVEVEEPSPKIRSKRTPRV
ncbi:hypothetical protein TSOC_000945 [Tetrabaena socialis]|uniref:Uncharacterized protein n=1 Tax=Tetrabaena socialis TaxID=47790 RepID=A0A2J8AI32_9CHLO|nr:hypothetical protein TSOC_000945 [Tetrabaena socialis]|eukprot:PNH12172.1 hypothetical protein TSOC_000945 [Tetrabaena socialis]